MDNILITGYLEELQAESVATRKCLERIPGTIYAFKPHEKSMPLGYLALLVADIPLWISSMIIDSVIDLATYEKFEAKGEFPRCLIDTWKIIWQTDLKRTYLADFEVYGPNFYKSPQIVEVFVGVNL